jgi:hypothetical protein
MAGHTEARLAAIMFASSNHAAPYTGSAPHTTLADLLQNLVMAYGLADHTIPPHRNAVVLNAKS